MSFIIFIIIAASICGLIVLFYDAYSDSNNGNYFNNISSTSSNTTYYKQQITPEWIKEQRNKMNRKYTQGMTLREYILYRDNYTCKKCGASKTIEPNLLLEVDHIVPVSKGGESIPWNLQTLCWKCNRSKSNKI